MRNKHLLILGGGTAGNIFSHRFVKELDLDEWNVTVVDQSPIHYYQPGFLFIPFGIYKPDDVVKNKSDLIHSRVKQIYSKITEFNGARLLCDATVNFFLDILHCPQFTII